MSFGVPHRLSTSNSDQEASLFVGLLLPRLNLHLQPAIGPAAAGNSNWNYKSNKDSALWFYKSSLWFAIAISARTAQILGKVPEIRFAETNRTFRTNLE